MSEVSSRPRVKSIACGVALPLAAGCAVLAAGAIDMLLSALTKAGKKAYEASKEAHQLGKTGEIKPITEMRKDFQIKTDQWARTLAADHRLNQLEAEKVAALLSLHNSPFAFDQAGNEAMFSSLKTFLEAGDSAALRSAKQDVMQTLENGHQELFQKGITLACEKATLKAGFTSVQTVKARNNMLRVIGTDSRGRSLVSEIITDKNRDIAVTSEVLGVSDGSCGKIMDDFDLALEDIGVRTSAPLRTHKEGVLDLAMATNFVRSKVMKSNYQSAARARKLNTRPKQGNRL